MPEQDSEYWDPRHNELTMGGVTVAECAKEEDAWFLVYLLEERGIRSAVLLPDRQMDTRLPQVRVAPDDAAQARSILMEPVPDGKREAYDSEPDAGPFVLPYCPNCASEQVVLEEVCQGNSWRCEQCRHRWTEAVDG